MPRTRSSSLQCSEAINGHSKLLSQSKTSVWIIENDMLKLTCSDGRTPDLVKLRHPRSGAEAMFLFSSDNSLIHEIFSFSEKRSWFVNDSVRENGKLQISTPLDSLFLFLPYFKKSKEEGKVVPLEDLLIDSKYPETQRVLHTTGAKNLHLLADQKGPQELNAWMYNEEKTIKWLSKKIEKVVEVLKRKQINVRGSATSVNYIKSSKEAPSELDNELYLKYAYGIVSEYLQDDLSKKLSSYLGLPEDNSEKKLVHKRKLSQTSQEENSKKVKVEEEEVVTKLEKPKVLSAKEKAMMKAASGTKDITMFFKKKL